jgi:uncharacterized protein (TIGR03083 family)
MDSMAMLDRLSDDVAGLQRVIDAADPSQPVPSCPGWTLADLATHVADVYQHKIAAMRSGAPPDPWPAPEPDSVRTGPPREFLRVSAAELLRELTERDAHQPTWTWFLRDQTVGFWRRRMMQETVIHRWDAENAVRAAQNYRIDEEVADDGVDEYLLAFLADDWSSEPTTGSGDVDVIGASHRWRVRLLPDEVSATRHDLSEHATRPPDATVRCADGGGLLLAIWGRRSWNTVETSGNEAVLHDFRERLAAVSQ